MDAVTALGDALWLSPWMVNVTVVADDGKPPRKKKQKIRAWQRN